MSKVVRKSPAVAVQPSEQPISGTTSNIIKLSPLDEENYVPCVALLVFEHPINDAANTMKRALSQALVHYYPFCGRCVRGADGGSSHIDCTGQDVVEFIAASADCSLKEAELLRGGGTGSSPSSLLEELAVCYPSGSYGPNDPLLSVQVTEFTCGGFVLGVTWCHAVADGVGIAQFIQAVGEFARGLPSSPSVAAVRWDEAVFSLTNTCWKEAMAMFLPALFDPAKGGGAFMNALEPLPIAFLDLTIPRSFIGRVKAEFPGGSCTTFEVITAVLWRCRTRAIMMSSGGGGDPDALCAVSFVVNVRKHVGAKDGYYGNCAIGKLVVATRGMVASADIVDLIKMIKDAKEQVAHELINFNESKGSVAAQQQQEEGLDRQYSFFVVSSWANIGFDEADFGSGLPARVLWHILVETIPMSMACLLPSKGRDGADVLSACVKEEHADAFMEEIAKLTN